MKKTIYTLLAISTLFFAACKKDNDNNPNSDSYQPFSTGSEWKFRTTLDLGEGAPLLDTTVSTMTSQTKKIGDKTFHVIKSVDNEGESETYIGFNNNIYSTFFDSDVAGGEKEYAYLDVSKAVGASWDNTYTIEDEDGDIEARLHTTVVAKGASKAVLGKTYNNVIHTKTEVQFKVGTNWNTVSEVNFYTAKGVGLIGIYSGLGDDISFKSELFSHTIK